MFSPATVWALLTSQVLPAPLPLRLPSMAVGEATPAPVTSCPTATAPEVTEPTVSTP